MTFETYWDTEGTRSYASSHEDRAHQAWDFQSQQHDKELIRIRTMLINLIPSSFSEWIAADDIVAEIDGMRDAD